MPLDDDDKKAIGEMIKGALSGEEFTKGLAKAVEAQVGKAVKAIDLGKSIGEVIPKLLDEKLEAVKAELKPPPTQGQAQGQQSQQSQQQAQGHSSVQDDPEFKKLKSQLADMERANRESAKRAEEAETRRKAELLNNSIRDALTSAGADPKRIAFALPVLKERNIVKLDDEGRPVFVLKRDWGEESVGAEDGAREWLQTDDGKFFVPATGKQGTGDKVDPPRSAARAKDGKVDWGSLAGRMNFGVLDSLE